MKQKEKIFTVVSLIKRIWNITTSEAINYKEWLEKRYPVIPVIAIKDDYSIYLDNIK